MPNEKGIRALRLANEARAGAGEEGQKWWSDEPVSVAQVRTLALQQLYAYLSRPNTREATRVKLMQMALRLDPDESVAAGKVKRLAELMSLSKGPEQKQGEG